MKKIILPALLAILSFSSYSQTFTNTTGGPVPDDQINAAEFPITVSGLTPSTLDASFGVETICLNISHTWNADLDITLIAPDGTMISLSSYNGGDSDNYQNTCFNQSTGPSITTGWGPFSGTYRPQGNLGYMNNGQNGNGTWKIRVFDSWGGDVGYLFNWSITFGNTPAPPVVPYTDSNLPILIINTNNQVIPDNPKIMADFSVKYNGPGIRNYMTDPDQFTGKIGIETRGSSSQMFPKKTFGFETWDALGNEMDTSLLGLPSESDWILSASYTDKSLMNNMLAYKLFRDFGYYAPRTKYVEVVLNGQYQGVYILMEKIKRDKNRVDVPKLTLSDTTGVDVTGGYIIKIDKTTGSGGGAGWTSPFAPLVNSNGQQLNYQYEYPSADNIMPQQAQYIESFVDTFEFAAKFLNLYDPVNGWRAYADEFSFIHYFILNEVSKNVDGYRLSSYLHKTKSNGSNRISAGPPWDYDLAFANADYCQGSVTSGWAYEFGNVCPGDGYQLPFWWGRFMQDTLFRNNLKCLYTEHRMGALDTTNLFNYIDSVAAELNESQQRNFNTWPILGAYVWPNPSPIPTTYQGEVDEMKEWLRNRLAWLDINITGNCTNLDVLPEEKKYEFTVYPNPFSHQVSLVFNSDDTDDATIEIFNSLGQTVKIVQKSLHTGQNIISVSLDDEMNKGVYFIRLNVKQGASTKSIIKY